MKVYIVFKGDELFKGFLDELKALKCCEEHNIECGYDIYSFDIIEVEE
jgi:hypothetical protein